MLQDRRQSPRLAPASPHLVHVGNHSTGLLFNLSESGLAVDGLLPDIHGDVFELALDLPEANIQILGTAQAAWTGNLGHRTGMRFVHLSDSTRQQLKEWISTQASAELPASLNPPLLAPAPAVERRPVLRHPELNFSSVPLRFNLGKPSVRHQTVRKHGAWRRTLSLILTIASISIALVLLGYYLANRGDYRPTQTLAAAPKLPELAAPSPTQSTPPAQAAASNAADDAPLPAPATSLPSTLSLDNPGFVIQVAAMEHEDNADALSNSLQKKNFPAFVYKRDSERLYKVAVGSYPDANSAATAQRELQKEGFKAIVVRWSPE